MNKKHIPYLFLALTMVIAVAGYYLNWFGVSTAGVILATGPAAGASSQEILDYFKNEFMKIDLTNPDTLNGIKTSITEGVNASLNGLGDKLTALIDEVKNSQTKPPEAGANKIWCHKLLKDNELNSKLPEETLNNIGMNRLIRLEMNAVKNNISEGDLVILRETRANILNQHAVQNETTAAEGGSTVPTPTGNILLDAIRANGIWLTETTMVPMSSNSLKVPVLAASGHTTTAAATLFKKEASTATPRRYSVGAYSFGVANLLLKDYGFIIPVTRELQEDGIVDIMALVKQYVGEYFGVLGDDILFRGNGQSSTDQTLGIYEYTGLTEFELAGNAFNSLIYEDIINGDALHRTVDRSGLKRYMSPSVWAYIKTLQDGSGRYILDSQERLNNVLEGKPVIETDSAYTMAETGASKPMIITGNLKRVMVGVKSIGMEAIKVSQSDVASFYDGTNTRHLWQENMLGIRCNMRFDMTCGLENRLVAHVTKA